MRVAEFIGDTQAVRLVILSEDFAPACRSKTAVEGPRALLQNKRLGEESLEMRQRLLKCEQRMPRGARGGVQVKGVLRLRRAISQSESLCCAQDDSCFVGIAKRQ
jgi:hypothetical protein